MSLNRMPLDAVTLDAVQAAAIRIGLLRPDIHFDKLTLVDLVEQLGRATTAGRLADQSGDTSGFVGALLDLSALALLWVEQIDHDADATRLHDPALVRAREEASRKAAQLVDAAHDAAELLAGVHLTPAGFEVPADLDDDPRLWTGEPMTPTAEAAARAATDLAVTAAPVGLCQWSPGCMNVANGTMPHPVLGEVPICDRCRAKIEFIGGAR